MSQFEFDCAVAKASGESMSTVRRRGFSVIETDIIDFDSQPNLLPAQFIDWDALEAQRHAK